MQQSPCHHLEEEGFNVGTWVAEEVKLEVKKGYRVTDVSIVLVLLLTKTKKNNNNKVTPVYQKMNK